MKKIVTIILATVLAIQAKAQLSDFQKENSNKVVFFDHWLSSRLNETASETTNEIELGKQFFYRAYFADKAPAQDGKLDLRLTCEGVSVTLNDMYLHAKANFYTSKGILPNYDQIEIPGVSSNWKNSGVFSNMGFAKPGQFESLLRFLLSKIDAKITPGANLPVKYEIVQRTKGEYRMPGIEYKSLAEGTLTLKVPAKEKLLTSEIYRMPEMPGITDKDLEATIKKGILVTNQDVISDVYKIVVVSNSFNIEKAYNGTPLNQWIKVRVIYKGKTTGEVFTGFANVAYNYNGSGFDKEVSKVYFQCGNTFAISAGVK
jgi:hypothetical protein